MMSSLTLKDLMMKGEFLLIMIAHSLVLLTRSDESEGESNHLLESEEDVDLTKYIDYDDVAEHVRRSSRHTKLPLNLNEYVVDSKVKFHIKPSNYKEAINDNNWVKAMKNKMETLNRNQTLEIIELPKGRRPIGCKWIYKIRYKSNEEIESQKKNCIELLHEFRMLGCKPISISMEPNNVLNFKVGDDDPSLNNINGYQKLVGKLIYFTYTRPDIAYIVHCLSQSRHAHLKSHLQAALNVLRYLKGSLDKGIRYTYSHNSPSEMVTYADSN
ncbi:hypothetical protein Tco_0006038 [Tanacetum coccineum]